jgi:hypothetical protein
VSNPRRLQSSTAPPAANVKHSKFFNINVRKLTGNSTDHTANMQVFIEKQWCKAGDLEREEH